MTLDQINPPEQDSQPGPEQGQHRSERDGAEARHDSSPEQDPHGGTPLEQAPRGYAAMDDRSTIKVMLEVSPV